MLLRADGHTELLQEGGPLLGAIEQAEFHSGQLTLDPGDTLVAYSDGVLECCNPTEEEFGTADRYIALRQKPIGSRQAHDHPRHPPGLRQRQPAAR